MSRSAGIVVLFFALVSGLLASATVMKLVRQQNEPKVVEIIPTDSVVICKETIPAGSKILPTQIALVQRPPETLPDNAIKSQEAVLGRVTKSAIYPGEVIVENRLVDPGSPSGLPAIIPNGMRAITLRVDDTTSVAGFIRPGHHVDILTTLNVGEEQGGTVSKTILQNVKVIATGKEVSDEQSTENQQVIPTVTVLVTLEQAERITLATKAGFIQLVLRNHEDINELFTEGVTLDSLIPQSYRDVSLSEPILVEAATEEEEEEPVEVIPPKPVRVIEVFRGSERTDVTFAF